MRIVFNTNYTSAATFIGIDQLIPMLEKDGHTVARNDWDNYQNYDVVFFASPDSKVRESKKRNPSILTCIIDPKISWRKPHLAREVRVADFLLVSSLEHRDFFLKYNQNPFIYYFFSQTPKNQKQHTDKKPIVIGYHGNKVHLDSMEDVSWALDKLSEKYDVEFRAIYNFEKLGKWEKNRPKKCRVVDVQWTPDMAEDLKKCDIGVSPSLHSDSFISKLARREHEYLFRFKYSNGPGRIYSFAMLGIPVIADASPSQAQFIQNGASGFICCTKEGWYDSLEKLIKNANLRSTQGQNLYNFVESNYSIGTNFQKLTTFIQSLLEHTH